MSLHCPTCFFLTGPRKKHRLSRVIRSNDLSRVRSTLLKKTISTNDTFCENLNKEAMSKNYVARALDEGRCLRTLSDKLFFKQKLVPTKYIERSKHHHGDNRGWVTSRNRRRAHLKSIMTINVPAKRPRHHENCQINFFAHEENIIDDNSNDPIVISPVINN